MSQFSSAISNDGDDDFQIPLTQTFASTIHSTSRKPLKSFQSTLPSRPPKKSKHPITTAIGKENLGLTSPPSSSIQTEVSSRSLHLCNDRVDSGFNDIQGCKSLDNDLGSSLDSIELSIVGCSYTSCDGNLRETSVRKDISDSHECDDKNGFKINGGYLQNSIESRLMKSRSNCFVNVDERRLTESNGEDYEAEGELDLLLKLCSQVEEEDNLNFGGFLGEKTEGLREEGGLVQCPLCGVDISDLSNEQRLLHTNDCLDKLDDQAQDAALINEGKGDPVPGQVLDESRFSPVLKWLQYLGLSRYEGIFVREEIDWDTLQWLTDEDLFGIGITALGPRKKIVHSLSEIRKGAAQAVAKCMDSHVLTEDGNRSICGQERDPNNSEATVDETSKLSANKLITDYFPGATNRKRVCTPSSGQNMIRKNGSDSGRKSIKRRSNIMNPKFRNVPIWCCIPGTPFRVDAFRYLRGDCVHWFLTHFHLDHYQGLTRSFCHGKIYCSDITAKLVNMKIGIPWERLQVLPINQKVNIAGTNVTCLDANHCPGALIMLFEPPNGKHVLHTGDFRFCEKMASSPVLQTRCIDTLILDTTYCNPQYDFPKQEAVIQFVIEAIQAEAFNPRTLFLIGSYTIGKERIFLEVARVLRKKVHVTASKLRILKCLGFPEEDMQWLTSNEQESQIHIVPLWTVASFKRLKHISNQYASRFSLIVAFSPTGWTFGKGKRSLGKRSQQGTMIRYEVPYSEHSSFTELKEFVKLISPDNLIPSVNNHGSDSARDMISILRS